MARKSPRSRRKAAPAARVRRALRSPTSPRKRAKRPSAASATGSHTSGTLTPPGRAKPARARGTAAVKRRRPVTAAKPACPARAAKKTTARGNAAFAPPEPARVAAICDILERTYPDARCALDFKTPLQLLIATILSAQCTDVRVNLVTPGLFERYPDAPALAAVPQEELEAVIRSTGFFRNKARAIRECCADLVAKHGGQVPRTLEELTRLRGVGRKTANVVLGNAYGIPGLVVDTHVTRLSHRLGLTDQADAVKIEFALMPIVPRERWTVFSHWLILHGRAICIARKPRCSVCPLLPHCPRLGVTVSE